MRTIEDLAPAAIAEMVALLTKLTTGQPTTAELLEARTRILPAINRALGDWIDSRGFAAAYPGTYAMGQALRAIAQGPDGDINSPAEDEAMDALEARARLLPPTA